MIQARNPRTGAVDAEIPEITGEALAAAGARARQAQVGWRDLRVEDRAAALRRLAVAIGSAAPEIQAALEADTGRRRIARLEIDSVLGAIEGWIATAGALPAEAWTPGRMSPQIRHRPQFLPYGLVGVISPWNFPLLLGMIDALPALMAGCAVIVKPSEVTPRFIAPLNAAIVEAGLGDLLAVVAGGGASGQALIDLVDCVCFTGSVATGRKVAVHAAGRLIPAFLELGGKDPLVVLAGADLEAATDAALRGSVLSTGQACQSIERIYVAAEIVQAFTDRLVEKARTARLNWPDMAVGEIGPIIFERQAQILAEQIADARAQGAQILTGGEVTHQGGGSWLAPTVLTGVTHQMKVMTEETFGPVLPIMTFGTVEEAVALANFGEFGLSAAVFGPTLDAAEAVGRQIEAGAISLNDAALTALFYEAGKQSFKASGLGPSRMGVEGLTRFLRRKALIANTGTPAPLSTFSEEG